MSRDLVVRMSDIRQWWRKTEYKGYRPKKKHITKKLLGEGRFKSIDFKKATFKTVPVVDPGSLPLFDAPGLIYILLVHPCLPISSFRSFPREIFLQSGIVHEVCTGFDFSRHKRPLYQRLFYYVTFRVPFTQLHVIFLWFAVQKRTNYLSAGFFSDWLCLSNRRKMNFTLK